MSIIWAHYEGRPQVPPKAYSSLRSVAISQDTIKHLYLNQKSKVLGNWFEDLTGFQKFTMVGDDKFDGEWSYESPGCFSSIDEESYGVRDF
ncbi:hypothetical protein IFR04_002574 [Cadophora malorum]|uniref:Uncharacterized protein n=1 Tax=Cadophora malorum TaxID=108018 RepID=A0A8H7WG69_9HELO|nr:hypothetical protein IFR04_002574 [Cadophora malorum]